MWIVEGSRGSVRILEVASHLWEDALELHRDVLQVAPHPFARLVDRNREIVNQYLAGGSAVSYARKG